MLEGKENIIWTCKSILGDEKYERYSDIFLKNKSHLPWLRNIAGPVDANRSENWIQFSDLFGYCLSSGESAVIASGKNRF